MAYYKIPNITVAACWAHVRRKYEEALQGTSKNAADKLTNIQIGKQYCDRLFAIESEINGLAPDERLQKRKEMAEPLLKEFQEWVFHVNDGPKSLLGKAAHYTMHSRVT